MKLTSLALAFCTAAIITGCSEGDTDKFIEDWASDKPGIYYDDTKPNVIEVSKTANQTLEFTCDYCEGTGRPHTYITFSNLALLSDSTFSINERVNGISYTGGGEFSGNRLEYYIINFDSSGFIIVGTTTWFRGERN